MAMQVRAQAPPESLFSLGRVTATPGALKYFERNEEQPMNLIHRHVTGDWGDLCADDINANHRSIQDGSRILSAFIVNGEKLYVITEGDRSITTLLLASEY
jgi:hypothetical protein